MKRARIPFRSFAETLRRSAEGAPARKPRLPLHALPHHAVAPQGRWAAASAATTIVQQTPRSRLTYAACAVLQLQTGRASLPAQAAPAGLRSCRRSRSPLLQARPAPARLARATSGVALQSPRKNTRRLTPRPLAFALRPV